MDPARHLALMVSLLDRHPNLMLDIAWRVIDDAYFSTPRGPRGVRAVPECVLGPDPAGHRFPGVARTRTWRSTQGWLFIQQHDGKLTELTTNEPDDEETEIQGGGLDGKWRSSWKDGLQPEEIARGTVVITAGDGINPAYIQLLVSCAGPPRTGGDGPNMQALACWGSRFPARARMDPPTAQHKTSFMLGCPARAGNNPRGRLIDSRSCVVEPLPPAGGGRPVGGRPRTDSAGSSESRNLCAELGQLHPDHLAAAVLLLAILGGYQNRTHDPPPGHQNHVARLRTNVHRNHWLPHWTAGACWSCPERIMWVQGSARSAIVVPYDQLHAPLLAQLPPDPTRRRRLKIMVSPVRFWPSAPLPSFRRSRCFPKSTLALGKQALYVFDNSGRFP